MATQKQVLYAKHLQDHIAQYLNYDAFNVNKYTEAELKQLSHAEISAHINQLKQIEAEHQGIIASQELADSIYPSDIYGV